MPPGPDTAPTAPPGGPAPERRREGWPASTPVVVGLLVAGTLALYARVVGHGFIRFDDTRYVTENPVVRAGLSWRGLAWAFTTLHASNWHPLTWLSHMLDVQAFGMSPGAHHAVNAVLHAANAALVFLVLARMTGARGRSAVVAALFAIHPLRVESVAWIAERKDVLSALFGLLALLAYARHAERPGARRYAAVAALFALSLLAKPMWVTLPLLLLVLDFWPLRRAADGPRDGDAGLPALPRRSWPQLVVEKVPLLVLSAASSVATVLAQRRGGALTGLELPVGARLANAAVAYVRYVGMTFWPSSLSIHYPYARVPGWQAAAAAAVLAGVTAATLLSARRWPWLAAGWCWFVGTLVPVIGIVQVGSQSLADRYTYLPHVGLLVAIVWGVHRAAGARGTALRAAAAACVAVLAGVTWLQLGHWSSHEALFRHALAVNPDDAVAHGALSEGLRADGRLDEALLHAREAVRLDPANVRFWNNLAVPEREAGLLADAKEALERALRLDPLHASSWVNLGGVEQDLNDPGAAEAAYERATQLVPGEPEPWFQLGLLRARAGRVDDAMRCYREVVARAPDHFAAWTNLAVLYQGTGRSAEAGEAFAAATRADPESFVGWRNLGVYLAKAGQPAGAAGALRQALRLRPHDTDALRRLGLVALTVGAREDALGIASQLDAVDPRGAAEIRARAGASP